MFVVATQEMFRHIVPSLSHRRDQAVGERFDLEGAVGRSARSTCQML